MTEPTPQPISTTPRVRGLKPVLARNIAALTERRSRELRGEGLQQRMARVLTRFIGSMTFVYIHAVLLAGWVAVNLGAVPALAPFDKTFVVLATAASVEAIFLSTFVLISQNRDAASADRRADLDVQINLLAEHEVSRLLELTVAIARKVGVDPDAFDEELGELARDVAPETVLDGLDDQTQAAKTD